MNAEAKKLVNDLTALITDRVSELTKREYVEALDEIAKACKLAADVVRKK